MRRSGNAIAVAVLTIFLLPTAGATEQGSFELGSGRPVFLDANVTVHFPAGSARIEGEPPAGTFVVAVAHGIVAIETWSATRTPQGPLNDAHVERVTHTVRGADMLFEQDGGTFAFNVVASQTGVLRAQGRVVSRGEQTWLEAPYDPRTPPPVIPPGGTYVDVELDRSDAFVGNETTPVALIGFPLARSGALDMEGSVRFHVHGGNVSFQDADGERATYRLGRWSTSETPLPALGVDRETWQRLIFEGEVVAATLPTGEEWILGGPAVEWEIDGDARWVNATGRVSSSASTRTFRDTTFAATGTFRVATRADAALAVDDERSYLGEGSFEAITISGAPLRAHTSDAPRLAGLAALAAALVMFFTSAGRELLGRALVVFHTRLTREDLLQNKRRRAIVAAVEARPGIHLRALQRQVGGAWGAFSLHLGMLLQAGYLHVRREGRYSAVFPRGNALPRRAIVRSDTARRILAALPPDGSSLPVKEVRERTGMSRQLADHHLRRLAEAGHVELIVTSRGDRLARIAAASAQTHAPSS